MDLSYPDTHTILVVVLSNAQTSFRAKSRVKEPLDDTVFNTLLLGPELSFFQRILAQNAP